MLFFLDGLSYVVAAVLVFGLDRTSERSPIPTPSAGGVGLAYLRGAGRASGRILVLQVCVYLVCMPLYVTFLSLVDGQELVVGMKENE